MIKFRKKQNNIQEQINNLRDSLNNLMNNYEILRSIVKKSADIYNNHYHSVYSYSYSSGKPNKYMNAL